MSDESRLQTIFSQAQMLSDNMQSEQEKLFKQTFTGQSDDRYITLSLNGKHELLDIDIDDALRDDIDAIKTGIAQALSNANKRIAKATTQGMLGTFGELFNEKQSKEEA